MKILYVTTIGMTMGFFTSLIRKLMDEGHTVDIATNESTSAVPEFYKNAGCTVHQISCSRSPFDTGNIKAVGQIKKIVSENGYDIVHCHTPIAAACTRLACRKARKKGVKVFYTSHGLHFHNGAPLKNWLIYYPVEKFCAHFTDVLITINNEDYERAKKKLKAKKVEYVPGVGVDIEKFGSAEVDKRQKRSELGVPEDAFLLLSVGEVNENKNHKVILKAMAKVNDGNVHYAVAGEGNQKAPLLALAKELGIGERVHLLGYRKDINELCAVSDAFCFPSYREGLGLAAIEGMIYGLPIITSDVHGINDYSVNGVSGYKCDPDDSEGFADAVRKLLADPEKREEMARHNRQYARKYDVSGIIAQMKKIYYEGLR